MTTRAITGAASGVPMGCEALPLGTLRGSGLSVCSRGPRLEVLFHLGDELLVVEGLRDKPVTSHLAGGLCERFPHVCSDCEDGDMAGFGGAPDLLDHLDAA